MKLERLKELAGCSLLCEQAKRQAVIKCSDGKFIRRDGYEKTDDINSAKLFASVGAARAYITTKLSNFNLACDATEVETTIKEIK